MCPITTAVVTLAARRRPLFPVFFCVAQVLQFIADCVLTHAAAKFWEEDDRDVGF